MHITIICNASIDLKMKIYRQNDYFIIICQIVIDGNNCNYAAVNPDFSVARELFVSNLF